MRNGMAICILLLMHCSGLQAQHLLLKGTIINKTGGQAVVAATVQEKGGNITAADAKGAFILALKKLPALLLVTATGFDTAMVNIVSVKEKEPVLVQLQQLTTSLQEVVVSNGYQLLPKERATGSFENIDHKLLNRSVGTDVLERLDGVASGLYFNRNRGGKELFIRGLSTLNAGTEPLIVLDNFPYEGTLDNINPNNIESISILRDAAAASIWGAKAANGVIVITTRKGKYNQTKHVFVNTALSIAARPRLMESRDFMSAADFIGVERFLFDRGYYDGDLANNYDYPLISPVVELLSQQRSGQITQSALDAAIAGYSKNDIRKDYLQYLYRPAITQQYSAGISGGGIGMNYLLSFGYDKLRTDLVGNDGYRANINSQLNIKLLPKLELQTGLVYTLARNTYNGLEDITPGGNRSVMYPYARLVDDTGNPLAVIKDRRGAYTDTAGLGLLQDWHYRPLEEMRNSDNVINRNDLLLKLGLKYELSKTLNLELKGQLEKTVEHSEYNYGLATYYTRNFINLFSQRSGDGLLHNVPVGGILDNGYRNLLSAGARAQVNYAARLGSHYQLNALAGMEIRNTNTSSQTTRTYGYDANTLGYTNVDYNGWYPYWDNLGSRNIENRNAFGGTENRYVSYFANAGFTIRDLYTLSASMRKDASNLFGVNTNQQWNPFWSAGIGWKLSGEKFYGISWLPLLKARLSYGYSGNILPGVSGKALIYYSQNYDIPLPYAYVQTPANPNLRWEQTGTLNAGIDFALKENRLSGSLEWYSKKSKDLFGYVPLDPTTGQYGLQLNSANLSSKGFNIKLNAVLVDKAVKWEAAVLLDHVSNRVDRYLNEYQYKAGYVGYGNSITPIAGQDPYALISFKWAGLDPTNGDPQGIVAGHVSKDYFSINRTSTFSDLAIKGSGRPRYYGSIRNTVSYKGFSLSVNISYAFGYWFRRSSISYTALFEGWTMNKEFAERWQQPGDETHTNVPSMVYPNDYFRDNFYTLSEATIEKGDHIRLKDIQCSYRFVKSRLPFFQQGELYAYVNNIGIIWRANKRGIDPDAGDNLPAPVTVSLGFRTNF